MLPRSAYMRPWEATLQLVRNAYDVTPPERREIVFLPDGRYVDAYVGSRSWRAAVRDGRVTLQSIYVSDTDWLPGEALTARCRCRGDAGYRIPGDAQSDLIPGACKGHCGIYAWRAGILPTDPGTWLGDWLDWSGLVHGEVQLWGDVRIHERGYKATNAKPSAFYLWPQMSTSVRLQTEMAAAQWAVPLVQLTIPGAEECAGRGHKLQHRDPRQGVCFCACGLNSLPDAQAIDVLVPE